MQFKVPQFIDIEDKIFGPLTWKQFAYTLGGAGIVYLIFKVIPSTIVAGIVSIPIGGFFLALAFVKYNNKNFIDILQDGLSFILGNRVYTWQKSDEQSRDELISSVGSINTSIENVAAEIKLGKSNIDAKILNLENTGNAAGTPDTEEVK